MGKAKVKAKKECTWRVKKLLLTRKTYVVGQDETVVQVPLKGFFGSRGNSDRPEELGETSAVNDELVPDRRYEEAVQIHVDESQPSNLYQHRKEKARKEWMDIQPLLAKAYIEGHASFMDTECSLCTEESTVMCSDCGPFAFFCEGCSKKLHRSLLHKPMVWKGQLLKDEETRLLGQSHSCSTTYGKTLEVFDAKGRLHNVICCFCKCEPEAATLVRYSLWPTQINPRKAVSMELMGLIHFMQMEAHVSLKAACQVIGFQNKLKESEVKALYSELIQYSFSHFQTFHVNVDAQNIPESDCDRSCPACPKDSGQVIVCIDGCFGLVRRKKAGTSAGPPTHDKSIFLDDEYVRGFVDAYRVEHGQASKNCSRFKAGTLLRANKKADALDVKGIFGAVCRHGFPMAMLNMFHGESLAYSVCIIEHLQTILPEGITMHVAYDIACQLTAHLQKSGQTELLEKIKLVVPAFHAYGHKASCQRQFGIRNTENMGLTDGEATERLWAYLRRFSTITKEMTPSGRKDKLISALLHFSHRKQTQIAGTLCTMLKRAMDTQLRCQQELQDMRKEYDLSEEDIRQWVEVTKTVEGRERPNTGQTDHRMWQHTYFEKVARYEDTRCALEGAKTNEAARDLRAELERLDIKLSKMEKKHGVGRRWTSNDAIFLEIMREVHTKDRERLLIATRQRAMDRTYLTELIRKYARGQAIANRLTRQMGKVNNQIKDKLRKYNTKWNKRGFCLSFEQVAKPDDPIYTEHLLPVCPVKPGIPTSIFERAYSLHNRIQRSGEEIEMTKMEMKQMLSWQNKQEQLLLNRLCDLRQTSKYERGLSVILWMKVNEISERISSCRAQFRDYL